MLCEALKLNATITLVDFRNSFIDNIGAKCIGELLMHNTGITHIDLSWNDLGYDGGRKILEGLRHNTNLIDCQLSGSKCGEDTVHEVALLLRRNRSAAAYKAGGLSADPLTYGSLAVDTTLSPTRCRDLDMLCQTTPARLFSPARTILSPPASSTATMCTPRARPSSHHTKARLRMKQRETFLPDDHHFYGKVTDHIDQLEAEAERHRQNAAATEARERNAAANFADREHRLKTEISAHNDKISAATMEKNRLEGEVSHKKMMLNTTHTEHARAVQENVAAQHLGQAEEQNLQRQLRDVNQTNAHLRNELAALNNDLSNLRAETSRLRTHLMSFQRDAHSILAF